MLSTDHADPRPKVLTVEEAGAYLRLGRSAAYRAAASGQIPTIRIGRTLRVPRMALERMLAEAAGQPQEKAA